MTAMMVAASLLSTSLQGTVCFISQEQSKPRLVAPRDLNYGLTYFLSSIRQPHSVHQLKGETLQKEESNNWGNRLTGYV